MRRLLWFTLGFVPGVAAVAYLPVGSWVLPVAAVCFVFFLSLIAYKAKDMRFAALFLLGVAVSLTWSWGFDRWKLSDLRPYDGTTVQTTVIASDYSYETQAGVGADGHIRLDGKTYRVRFYIEDKTPIQPGDKVTGSCYLRYTSIGGLEKETSHQGKGIFLLAYLDEDAQVEEGAESSARFFPAHLRQSIKNRIDSIFPEDTFAFARALLLGDSSALTNEEDSHYQTSGIRHIIAVSGLHISILFSAICLMVQNRKYLVALLGIPLLLLFSALTGFTPSVVRACVMQLVLILSLLVNKEYDSPTALAAAVLVILGINPMAVTSISFQLSTGCMAGIFAFSGRISGFLLHPNRLGPGKGRGLKARITRWFVGSVSVSLSAMVFTVPPLRPLFRLGQHRFCFDQSALPVDRSCSFCGHYPCSFRICPLDSRRRLYCLGRFLGHPVCADHCPLDLPNPLRLCVFP